MKKRWIAGLLCVLLLFQLGAPVRAAGSVYFVAAEESVLPLTDATMPFWSGGYLYVAASVFTNLGISVINNTAKGMTVLEKDRRALLFEWKKGSAQDSSGNIYTPGTIQSGGVTFVPASMVASFFGLQYSVTEVANGHLVWLRSPDFGMSAREFANAATYNMEDRYNTYTAAKSPQATEPETPEPETPEAPTVGARIHLCIEASQTAGNLLDALDRAKGWATFYCTPDYLEANGALLRRMTASRPHRGHSGGRHRRRAPGRTAPPGQRRPVPGHLHQDPAGIPPEPGGGGHPGPGAGGLALPVPFSGPQRLQAGGQFQRRLLAEPDHRPPGGRVRMAGCRRLRRRSAGVRHLRPERGPLLPCPDGNRLTGGLFPATFTICSTPRRSLG